MPNTYPTRHQPKNICRNGTNQGRVVNSELCSAITKKQIMKYTNELQWSNVLNLMDSGVCVSMEEDDLDDDDS